MLQQYKIAAYTRISVDTELAKDNTSIENQKAIIGEYCKLHFPTSTVDYFEDRDYSGYTFEQRPDYYYNLRPKLFKGEYDILIVKDLSRFSRRTGKGLAEFEDIAEHDIRIIAIGDGVDYCQDRNDDWLKIKLYFFVNEMPVTDASRKVLDVINSRQQRGEWICSVPYGYVITNTKKMTFEVDEPAAEVVRKIFDLYIEGWGYKKISNYLTDQKIPTPRMREKARKEAAGDDYKGKVRNEWSIVTVSEILNNDFYIGTLRQRKFHRKKINGNDIELDQSEHIVFENHHTPIVDYKVFATAKQLLKDRSTNHYRGIKKNDNTYSGLLFCGDCGSPMFALSRKDLAEAYRCGTYHRRGSDACSSHHIRADFLDTRIKEYVRKIRDNSASMLTILEEVLKHEESATKSATSAINELEAEIAEIHNELKIMAKQKIRDMARHSSNADIMAQTYDDLIAEANEKLEGLENQLAMVADTSNTIVRVNRITKNVIDIFDEILNKNKIDKASLRLIIDRIIVYEDRLEMVLHGDVDELLRTGKVEHILDEYKENAINFNQGTENIEKADNSYEIVAAQRAKNQRDKVFRVNVISGGDPLEIYTDRDGEVIFKKYSPIGELQGFASEYADSLQKTAGMPIFVCDRDAIICVSGASKREYGDRKISRSLEEIIESRSLYTRDTGKETIPLTDDGSHYVSCAMPIISEGDLIGCILSAWQYDIPEKDKISDEVEEKLIQTAGIFLGKQMEG